MKAKKFLKLFNKLFSIENIKYLRIFLYNIKLKYLIYLLENKKIIKKIGDNIMEFKDGDYQKRILNIYDYNYYYGSKIESGEVAIEKGGQL